MDVSMVHVEFMLVFYVFFFWIYMGHMNWNRLMLDDQVYKVYRLIGERWVSDVDAFVLWKVCRKA